MERISFKHSVIFFNFCILISPFYFIVNFEPIIFCLLLILILGISHGALDNIKGKKLFKLFGKPNESSVKAAVEDVSKKNVGKYL